MFKLFAFALVALFAMSMVNSAPILPRRHGDVDKPDCESSTPASTMLPQPTSSPAPEPTPNAGNVDVDSEDNDDGDDGDDDCDDEPSSEPSSTPASSPTPYENPDSTPTPTPTPTSTDDSTPSPTPSTSSDSTSSDSNSSGSDTHTGGDLTWFTQNGVAGACGTVHSDSDFIAALDTSVYGDTGAQSSYCGKTIRITWQGNSVDVVVADACPTCDNASSVDLSEAAFQALAPLSTGLLTGASWSVV